jgi:hypothetical protein
MNCQDISRIVDTGSIGNLGEAARDAAEAHARSCRDCAAIWGVQSRLAAVRVPGTPPQIAAGLRVLAALPDRTAHGRFPRRLVLIGSLVAVAAAAALLTVRTADVPVAEAVQAAAAVTTATELKAAAAEPVAAPASIPATPARVISRQPEKPVPLLPPPYLGSVRGVGMSVQYVDLALEKAVQRHPELVEGPQIDGYFVVGVALQQDGSVLASAVRQVPKGGVAAASAEIDALIPGDGALSAWSRPQLTRLRDGSALQGEAVLTVRRVPDGFDVSRSRARVLQILGDKYAHLMAPAASGALNRLEVFLSEDGRILREHVDVVRPGDGGSSLTDDPADIARFAAGIAARLGLDSRQIGVVGLTGVTQGLMNPVRNPAGGPPIMPDLPRMLIAYAWERRTGESASTLGVGMQPAQRINEWAALAVVERYVPDAFARPDPAAGLPVLILSAKGEFIRTGRLPPQTAALAVLRTVQEQAADGAPLGQGTRVKLTNAAGVTAEVYFAWQRPSADRATPTN